MTWFDIYTHFGAASNSRRGIGELVALIEAKVLKPETLSQRRELLSTQRDSLHSN